MTTNNANDVTRNPARQANELSADALNSVTGGLTFSIFGYSVEIKKDSITVCGKDSCTTATSKSVVTY